MSPPKKGVNFWVVVLDSTLISGMLLVFLLAWQGPGVRSQICRIFPQLLLDSVVGPSESPSFLFNIEKKPQEPDFPGDGGTETEYWDPTPIILLVFSWPCGSLLLLGLQVRNSSNFF